MPTGYTAGILNGTTKDFNEYAKKCSRAFIIHLRDEPLDSEYKKREPTNYHLEHIEDAENNLKNIESLTDEEIIDQEKNRLIESKKYHLEGKDKDEKNKIKLNLFLEKAKSYKPPTQIHEGIANFMVEQLESTIDFDCNSNYHIDELKKIDRNLEHLNADDIRSKIKIKANNDIAYHIKEHEEELKRCKESNKWYEDFINSLSSIE